MFPLRCLWVLFISCCVCISVLSGPGLNTAGAAAGATAVLTVRPHSQVEAGEITIGEVARIQTRDAGLKGRLMPIVLGRSPLPGKDRSLDLNYVRVRLKQHDLEDRVRVQGPERFSVTRSAVKISPEKISAVVSRYLNRLLESRQGGTVRKVEARGPVLLPRGRTTYEVIPPKNMELLGKIPVRLVFKVNGEQEEQTWTTAYIQRMGHVVTAVRSLDRRHLITRDDLRVEEADLADMPRDALSSLDEVIGKRTKRSIRTGAILEAGMVELPPLVKRGDVVVIIAESDAVRVTALGEVRERGWKGDRIRVTNVDSDSVIHAHVVDRNTVRVRF